MSEMDETTSQITETETETATYQRGIDVSNWQGQINWDNVAKAGIKHVCMKMSEGGSFVDRSFVTNWKGAKAAKINTNCYHYFRALGCAPIEQMENIRKNLEVVTFDPAKSFLAIDVEQHGNEKATPAQMADNLKALLNLIEMDPVLKQRLPVIYTSSGYWDSKIDYEKYNFGAYPLWVAHWNTENPRIPKSWKNWIWWQHSSKGEVDGINGNVDLDWVKV